MDLVNDWKNLKLSPELFDLVYLQLNEGEVAKTQTSLRTFKMHPLLQGQALKGVQCLEDAVRNLGQGLDTSELYLKYLRELMALIPRLLEEAPESATLSKLNDLMAEMICFRSALSQGIEMAAPVPVKRKILGDYLVELGFVTRSQVDAAFESQRLGFCPGKRLGDILQATGIITRAELDAAIERQMLDGLDGD